MHSIGNSLKDVKVEFKKELKLDVSDISIEGENRVKFLTFLDGLRMF